MLIVVGRSEYYEKPSLTLAAKLSGHHIFLNFAAWLAPRCYNDDSMKRETVHVTANDGDGGYEVLFYAFQSRHGLTISLDGYTFHYDHIHNTVRDMTGYAVLTDINTIRNQQWTTI